MEKIEKQCPYCHNNYKRLGTHFYCCEKLKNKTQDEIHIINLQYQTNNVNIINDVCNDYENLYSLPDLKNKYGLCYKHLGWILNYKNIYIRNISESQKQITVNKIKNTLQQKYGDGIINPGQIPEVKEKVKQTFLKHYGVDNIWKTKEYAEFTSKRWATYNKEKKLELIHKWTKQEGRISKIENKIVNILNELNIPIETQFKFPKYFHKYDILLKGTNIIIEIQGDFWHANPNKFKATDQLNFPGGQIYIAEQLWKKDLQHIHYAESQNYKVIQIWESDINKHEKQQDLNIFLLDILNKYI